MLSHPHVGPHADDQACLRLQGDLAAKGLSDLNGPGQLRGGSAVFPMQGNRRE